MSNFVITVATAAARMQTNSNVINRWIQEGHIPTVETDRGVVIPLEPFERICQELEQWLSEDEADEGSVRVADLEEFWKQRG